MNNGFKFRFTITLSAISAAARRVREFQSLDIGEKGEPYKTSTDQEVARDTVAAAVDRAVSDAWDNGRVQEVVDTMSDCADTRIARVNFKDQKLVAILVARRPNQPLQYRQGREAFIVVSMCTYHEAHSCFINDEWRAIPGQIDRQAFARPSSGGTGFAPGPMNPVLTAEVGRAIMADPRQTAMALNFGHPPRGQEPTKPLEESPPSHEIDEEEDDKPARGGTMFERTEYAKSVLRERPSIATAGADGLCALVKRKFGTGMSAGMIRQLRDVVAAESQTPQAVADKQAFLAECNKVYQKERSVAERLAAAVDVEIAAGAALDAARNAAGVAQHALDAARQEVDALEAQLLANRPSRGAATRG